MMKYAVQCLLSFGDCIFSTPLTRAVAARNPDGMVPVVTAAKYADAYANLPWVSRIMNDPQELPGYTILDSTPGDHFWGYKAQNREFCLFDTHRERAATIGIDLIDQRPIFIPTAHELQVAEQYWHTCKLPLMAVESAYFSGQSWSCPAAITSIVQHYACRYNIIWLSNQDAPASVDDGLRFTRRELICILNHCEILYSTGSGFFCASLALNPGPATTICLWKDETYRYEHRLAQVGWRHIDWVHNQSELDYIFMG